MMNNLEFGRAKDAHLQITQRKAVMGEIMCYSQP